MALAAELKTTGSRIKGQGSMLRVCFCMTGLQNLLLDEGMNVQLTALYLGLPISLSKVSIRKVNIRISWSFEMHFTD